MCGSWLYVSRKTIMANIQDEMIDSTNVKRHTSNNAFGALGTTTIALDKEILRSRWLGCLKKSHLDILCQSQHIRCSPKG